MTNEQAKAIRILRDALADICDPIAAMQRDLPEGYSLNGAMAVAMCDKPQHYRDIAAKALAATESATDAPIAAGVVPVAYLCPDCGTHEVAITRTCHNSACKSYAEGVNIHEGWNPPSPTTALHDYTAASMELAAMIMSDCGCACFEPSTDSLAIRIATRIDAHTAAQVAANKPAAIAAARPSEVSVPRATLEMIYEAMNHMGDVLNAMDAVEDEDEEKAFAAFDAIRELLGVPAPDRSAP